MRSFNKNKKQTEETDKTSNSRTDQTVTVSREVAEP